MDQLKKLLFVLIMFLSIGLKAQPGDPSQDPDVPITGIEILLVAGGILGARKFLQGRKKSD